MWKRKERFKVLFKENLYQKGDILMYCGLTKVKVVKTPTSKKWYPLYNFFHLKIDYYYTLKVLK